MKGIPFTLISLIAGWWGFPWGPIYNLEALICDLRGGEDVTTEYWHVEAADRGMMASSSPQ